MKDEFSLPHSHGEKNAKALYGELNSNKFIGVTEVIKQLSDPTRLRIFWLLCHYEECVINIAAMLSVSSPAVSHHLRSLCESGLLESRREGKEVYYKVSDKEECRLLHKTVEEMMEITCPDKSPDYGASNKELMETIHGYLIEHLDERVTIEDLSKLFLMNATTLQKAFKETYGDSVASHMKKHRMEKAKRLISSTGLSILEIAKSVGYESQSRFSEVFRKTFGMLPSDYRKEGVDKS